MSTQPSAQVTTNSKILEFEPIEENWNRYELKNGVVVRGRLILTRVFKNPEDVRNNTISYLGQNTFIVDAPTDQRSEPTPNNPAQEIKEINSRPPVQIIAQEEKWNKYRIPQLGAIIKIKLLVDEAMRLDNTFDSDWMPRYTFRSTLVVLPVKSNLSDQL